MPAIGDTAPDFEMLTDEGKRVKLSDFHGKKVVLYFYPEDFTSGCELQACSFRDAYPKIEAKNAIVLGVSPDSVDSHQRFREALHLPFHLLVDEGGKVASAWGSYNTKTSADGKPSGRTQRSHFIINEDGTIIDVQNPVKSNESTKLALEKLGA